MLSVWKIWASNCILIFCNESRSVITIVAPPPRPPVPLTPFFLFSFMWWTRWHSTGQRLEVSTGDEQPGGRCILFAKVNIQLLLVFRACRVVFRKGALWKCRAANSRAASIEGLSMQSMGCWHTGQRNALGAAVQTFQFYLRFYNKDTKCPTLCQIILSSGMNGE